MTEPRRAAVIGAGVMGSGIAAHLANAGLDVTLLDAVPGAAQRRARARCRASDPPALRRPAPRGGASGPATSRAISAWSPTRTGSSRPSSRTPTPSAPSSRASTACGAPARSSPPTRRPSRSPSSPRAHRRSWPRTCSSRTSSTRRATCGCWSSSPARRPGPRPSTPIEALGDVGLGKAVVRCADTPGFVGNRLGAYWIGCAVGEAVRRGIPIEDADAAIAKAFGTPRTGVFALLDLVGLDLMLAVDASLAARLPADDPYQALDRRTDVVERLVAAGHTGRKGDGGFYRRDGGDRSGPRPRDRRAIDRAASPAARPRPPPTPRTSSRRRWPTPSTSSRPSPPPRRSTPPWRPATAGRAARSRSPAARPPRVARAGACATSSRIASRSSATPPRRSGTPGTASRAWSSRATSTRSTRTPWR